MTDTLFSYEQYNIKDAIVRINALLDAAPEGKAKEFYQTISEVMIALSFVLDEAQTTRKAYNHMVARVEIMEALLAKFVKSQ